MFEVFFVTIPVSALVHPLRVIPESFTGEDMFFFVLLNWNWSLFFGDKITIP